MIIPNLPARLNTKKNRKSIRGNSRMAWTIPDRMATLLLLHAYQRHPYRFPVIGELGDYTSYQEQVMQYYNSGTCRIISPSLLSVTSNGEKVHQQLSDLFNAYPEKSLSPYYSVEPPNWPREVHKDLRPN